VGRDGVVGERAVQLVEGDEALLLPLVDEGLERGGGVGARTAAALTGLRAVALLGRRGGGGLALLRLFGLLGLLAAGLAGGFRLRGGGGLRARLGRLRRVRG